MPTVLKNAEFLEKVRKRFSRYMEQWKEIREQHDLDMRFLAGDQWDPKEQNRRKGKIPCVVVDMLSQYMNQLVNDVRQNKRAVNVLPKGNGATEKTAGLRADWVRGVEYVSQAQTAYVTAFEGAAGGSYGFWKLETYYDGETFDLSVKIVPITNANTIVYDPNCKLYDCSDAEDCFEIDFIPEETFERRYPKAEIKSFSDEIQEMAPDWLKPKQIQIASYWKVETEEIELHEIDLGNGQKKTVRDKHLPDNFDRKKILQSRKDQDRRIIQYVLNGVEVLETNDPKKGKGWPGKWIPIIPVWGKELFVDEGSGSVRKLLSLIRLARDPQRVVNYLASQQMMEAKLTPKTVYMGPRGMYSGHTKDWEEINDDPKAFAEWDNPEGFPPGSVKPERIPFVPNFQQYEMSMQAWERRIMGAMGVSPLPIAAQRQNEKSGLALERIQGERAQGSFHFIDNFDRSIVFCGKQLDDLFDRIYDTPRDIAARKEDGTHYVARIGDPNNPQNKAFAGDHDVVIEVGPSRDSQHDATSAFVDTLSQIPGVFPLIGDLLVRLRQYDIGPIAQQIAERLTPPQFANQAGNEDFPPSAKAIIGQAQQKITQLQQIIQQLAQEKAAKVVETEGKKWIASLQEQTKLVVAQATLNREGAESILLAELEKMETVLGERADALDRAHEATMANLDRAHEVGLASHQADLDRQNAEHAVSIAPSPESGQNGAGGTQ